MSRIIPIGIVLAAAGIFWDQLSTLVFRTGFLGESVPPIPAFVALLLLLPLRTLVRTVLQGRRRRAGSEDARPTQSGWFPDGDLLATYAFLTIAVAVCAVNGLRAIVDLAAIPYYGDAGDAMLNYVRPYWPTWFAPTDTTVIRWLYQGSPTGQVPWGAWIVPMLCIGGILVLGTTASTALYGLLARRWRDEERLAYPIAELAVSVVCGEGGGPREAARSLFRTPTFWVGTVGAVAFNAIWILPACFSTGPIPPAYTNLNLLFPTGPWQAGYIWFLRYNPVVLGLGVLVPSDVLFSTWFSTLLLKVEAVILAFFGQGWSTTFFLAGRQGFGGYLVQAVTLLMLARPILGGAVRALLGERTTQQARSEGRYLLVLVAAALGLVWVMAANQMPVWLAVCLVAMLLVLALVNGRIRTQVGVPIVYLHGGGALEITRGLTFLLGGKLIGSAGPAAVTAMTVFSSPMRLTTMLAPSQADGFRLAEDTGDPSTPLGAASPRGRKAPHKAWARWAVLSVLAVVVGVAIGLPLHLSIYYRFGGEYLKWAPSNWNIAVIVKEVQPLNPSPSQWLPVLAGVVTTLLYTAGQRASATWPLHPIGFITAGAIGGYVFGQFLLAWIIKTLALRYGGRTAFVRVKEFMLGLVIAHFCLATVWAVMGMLRFEPATRYLFAFY